MRRWLAPLMAGLVAVMTGFWLTLNWVPGFLMAKAMDRVETAAAINTVWHGAPTDETTRSVVRPSPDILYSVCAFDLGEGNVVLNVPWPEDGSYASVSFYDANTNNFAVINDRDDKAERDGIEGTTSIVLFHLAGSALSIPPVSVRDGRDEQIASPTQTGLALYRRVVMGGTSVEDADTGRRGFSCEVVG